MKEIYMMQSKEKITRANTMDIIRRFAKEYRKTFGKSPAEIIVVGGGSINTKNVTDVIARIREKMNKNQ